MNAADTEGVLPALLSLSFPQQEAWRKQAVKKPLRTEIKAKQWELAHLQQQRMLRAFLPKNERSQVQIRITPRGRLITVPALPDQDLSMLSQSERAMHAELTRMLQKMALSVGAKPIYDAEAKYREEYEDAIADAREGIEEGNMDPFMQHLALLGFSFFEDSAILQSAQTWWREAKEGKKDSAEKLAMILKALAVGRGPLGEKTERQRQEDTNKRQRLYKKQCKTALKKLREAVTIAIRDIPRSILRDPIRYQAERARLTDCVISQACAAADGPTRNAGKQAKVLRIRGLL